MEECKIIVVLFALISLNRVAVAGPNFQHALDLINAAKPNINYDTFCVKKAEGEEKIACRIKDEPTVGFLVCKSLILDGAQCVDVINNELQNLAKLGHGTPIVKTVEFRDQPIDGVKCGETPDLKCSGFLEEWVAEDKGRFEHVRDAIAEHTIPALIQRVKGYTSKAGLATTAADLDTMKTYMEAPATKYRQICDLQGFFLLNGGFLVNDVPDILEHMKLTGACWPGEPTTQEVLTALADMIEAFKK